MKIIFAGTPEFAVPALVALIQAGHNIVMVLTQPDRPAGRGMRLRASPVKQLALQHGLIVYQPASLKLSEVQAAIAAVECDVMIVAAYGLIIPTTVLNIPKKGCYNIHGSLLPRWRGAAPIHRAILAGDVETGVTIMEVVPKLDAGAMISKGHIPILGTDTTQSLHDAISQMGAALMVDAMMTLQQTGQIDAEMQDEALVTYAHKVEKSEAILDWGKTAIELSRQVRAFNPFPVATALFRGETCRIWFATAVKGHAEPGEINQIGETIQVGTGEGLLEVRELQMPGAKRQNAQQFIQGYHVKVGEFFK
ncbi:MAG: methionyl-tRNA formyltransferase [Methylophilaceae bacterium]|nr:methionyl-tRNA formyltransferase [Methylophilaceae bacterium]MDG1820348.1 methionyl-tRNA formyltransferase [Methylophilaceae bacterium]